MLKLFKLGVEPGWLSLCVRPARVDLIHVRRERDRPPRVTLADSVGRDGEVAQALITLRKSMRLDRYRCTTLLAHGAYQLIQTEAVPGPRDEARNVLRWKLKDQVDFPVEAAAVDLLPIPGENRTPQVFAALAAESVVAPLVQSFQAAKIRLEAIDLPELSQRNLAALFEQDGRGLATLIIDEDEGLLTFTANAELLVVRHVEINAGQLRTADQDRRERLFDRIALDVQRSLDNFDRNYSSIPLSGLVVAPIPGVDGFLDYLRANLTLGVAPLDLPGVLDLGTAPALRDPLRQFQCLRAIGAALRDEPVAA